MNSIGCKDTNNFETSKPEPPIFIGGEALVCLCVLATRVLRPSCIFVENKFRLP